MTARLITIGPSHYCEKARWALQRAAIPHVEEAHPPPFHAVHTLRLGGKRTVPVLVDGDVVLTDSTDILRHIQAHADATWRPYPTEEGLRADVEALEDRFDEVLGPHARRLAYFHLLPHREMVVDAMRHRAPGWEAAMFSAGFLGIRAMMRRSMRIDETGAERSAARLAEVFDEVDARLADGRPYLAGDRFTAADLTLASLAAPLVLPDGYGAPLPTLDALPPDGQRMVEEWRARPTGALVLRLYTDERATVAAPEHASQSAG